MRARAALPAAALALLLTAAVGGCTSGRPAPEQGPIVLATGSDLSSSGVRQDLIHAWERRTGRTVRIVKLPDTADAQRSQLLAAGQSGNSGYDVLNIDVAWTAEFAAAHVIRPWDGGLDGDFLPSVVKTATGDDGKIWAVPFNTDAGLLYYRKDILKKYHHSAEPPSNWGELKNVAIEVTNAYNREAARAAKAADKEPPPTLYGMVAQLRPYEGLTVNTLEAAWANGGNPDATSFSKGEQIGALQMGVAELKGRLDTIMPHEATAMDETESRRWFADGRALFMRNWPVEYASIAEKLTPLVQFDVAQLPARPDGKRMSVLGGQNLAIAADSTHPSGARALIEALTDPESERCLLERGFAATRSSAYRTAGGAPHCPLPPGDAQRGEHGAGGAPSAPPDGPPPYTQVLKGALLAAEPRPRSAHYQTFSKVVQIRVSEYLDSQGGTAIADELAKEADQALSGRE
ncbi:MULTISPECIES: extracellular solute-binding protein [Streptomyces]|uniref:ABC transporter substrate-binding protein n=2 Tax=Streptomyces TaxID=1883 RepID=A0A2N8PL38_STRNR|nr:MULTISPECIES: extracellular solute-binding protein [Streptomyces]PNE41735.1 ABC transporter substrate-binding protein [Streptomyces noursei]SHL90952.1 multiple sugar transport system substrate-binding protein [Streptomyces yunnanensis]